MTVELGYGTKCFNEGQALSQEFTAKVRNRCEKQQMLGNLPLMVTNYTPGIQITVDDPTRDAYWLGMTTEFEDLADQFASNMVDDMAVREHFLSGRLKLRSKIWQINQDEVAFLSNKPIRRIITVRLNKGDRIALSNRDGVPYVLTKD